MPKSSYQDIEPIVRRMIGYREDEPLPRTIRFERWNIVQRRGAGSLLVGVGTPSVEEFGPATRDECIAWLASPTSAPLDALREAFPLAPGPDNEAIMPDPDVLQRALLALLEVCGDLGMSSGVEVDGQVCTAIEVAHWSYRLGSLRFALQAALGVLDLDIARAILEAREPGITGEVESVLRRAEDVRPTLMRLFTLASAEWLLHDRLFPPSHPGGPHRVAPGETSPLLEVFFVIALSIGAIDPPHELPGVYRCEYHRCGRVFVSHKTGVGGKHRFCSKVHGQRFHAARIMKAKTNGARTNSAPKEK